MSETLAKINMRVPPALLQEAKEIASVLGMPDATLHRDLWIAGLQTYCERMNKIWVNKKLRSKYANADSGDIRDLLTDGLDS